MPRNAGSIGIECEREQDCDCDCMLELLERDGYEETDGEVNAGREREGTRRSRRRFRLKWLLLRAAAVEGRRLRPPLPRRPRHYRPCFRRH